MNQTIQFPDRESWHADEQMIHFPVLVGCFQRQCRLSAKQLQSRYGGDNAEAWLALFKEHRWDIEEMFESLVLNEADDQAGYYSLI